MATGSFTSPNYPSSQSEVPRDYYKLSVKNGEIPCKEVVVDVSFPKGRKGIQSLRQHPAPVISAATTHETFRPIYLTRQRSPYVIGGYLVVCNIEPRPSGLECDALTTSLPTVPVKKS
ncbi:hypothetical protein TNCV_920091 [Trichonephila clavipes]|nr:hypothetical protein TNCV_920091 [Trichonephila clavipes]